MDPIDTIFDCSAERLMRIKIPSNYAHAVLLDPPAKFGIGESETEDSTQVDEQIEAFSTLAQQVSRVLRPGGASLFIGRARPLAAWAVAAERAGLRLIADLMVLWDRSADPATNGTATLHSAFTAIQWHVRPGNRFTYRPPVTAASNVLICKPVPSDMRINPAELPVELYNYLITLFTYQGDTVVDPFCGSGASLVAAKNNKRRYVGCDVDEQQAAMATVRVSMADVEADSGDNHPLHLWANGELLEV